MCHCDEIKAWAEEYLKYIKERGVDNSFIDGEKATLNQLIYYVVGNCENGQIKGDQCIICNRFFTARPQDKHSVCSSCK